MTGAACGAIVKVSVAEPVPITLLATNWIVFAPSSPVIGVPEMTPVLGLRLKPNGSGIAE